VATNTPAGISLKGVKRATVFIKRSDHSAGSSVFSVTVSPDNSNYATYNKLISNVANANTETLTRVSGSTLSDNGVEMYSFSPEDIPAYAKFLMTIDTDGTNNIWLICDYGEPSSI